MLRRYDFQRACDANEIGKEFVIGQIYVEHLQSGLVLSTTWVSASGVSYLATGQSRIVTGAM